MAIEWIDSVHGSGCRAHIGTGLVLEISPDGVATRGGPAVPYVVKVFAATLSRRFPDRDDAKAAAERAARAFLSEALARMEN